MTGTTCSIFMCLIFWFPNHFEAHCICVSSTRSSLIESCSVSDYIDVCSRLVFSTFRLLTVVFLLVHTVFVEDINYESCIVLCYPRKTLTSKIMPIKARIF